MAGLSFFGGTARSPGRRAQYTPGQRILPRGNHGHLFDKKMVGVFGLRLVDLSRTNKLNFFQVHLIALGNRKLHAKITNSRGLWRYVT